MIEDQIDLEIGIGEGKMVKSVNLDRFVERSPLVLQEAGVVADTEGIKIAQNDNGRTEFYSIGQYPSSLLHMELDVGKKIRPRDDVSRNFSDRPNTYFLSSLANLIMFDEVCPALAPLMPIFFGAVVKDDKFAGILTEDYSRGKQEVVGGLNYPSTDIFPEGFLDLLGIDTEDRGMLDEVGRIFGTTNSGLRIMDVNRVDWSSQYEQRRNEIRLELRERDYLEPHVLNI